MQNVVRRLMRPDDMLETFNGLAVKEPDLMRLVLQASVAALMNVQTVEVADAEMKRQAVKGIDGGNESPLRLTLNLTPRPPSALAKSKP